MTEKRVGRIRHGLRVPGARCLAEERARGAVSGRAGRKGNMVKRDIGLWRMPVEP